MTDTLRVKDTVISLVKEDITDIEIESFVYYAQHNLALGSGFGTAISVRGGPSIQDELNEMGPLKTTEAVVSSAGNLKVKYIIHAVGPRFQEEEIENKLKVTIENILRLAESKGITSIALPPMGTGFYGIPLEVSAQVTLRTIIAYAENNTSIKDIKICLNDNRELIPFQKNLAALAQVAV
ncbi:MAG: macro domain-containing protein [Candidatus Zixiibacteriota bacterium]